MTDLWGTAAMVVAANRAVRTERVAKRMLSGVWFVWGTVRVASLLVPNGGVVLCRRVVDVRRSRCDQ